MNVLELSDDELSYLYVALKCLHRNEVEYGNDNFVSTYESLFDKVVGLIDVSSVNINLISDHLLSFSRMVYDIKLDD